MPTQLLICKDKILPITTTRTWISDPIPTAGYARMEAFLTINGLAQSLTSCSLVIEGTVDNTLNATWSAITDTVTDGVDSNGLTTTGTLKFIRNKTLYPWTRVKVVASGSATVLDLTVKATLYEAN